MEENTRPLLSIPTSVLLGSGIIAIAVLISGGIIKVKGINTNTSKVAGETTQTVGKETDQDGSTQAKSITVSTDDDPVLGDKDAPVTLIEFSDYECPFCKRYFDQTLPQVKKDYVDKGLVKIVYRDLPLSFHDPMATTEAIAANCAREQKGDEGYFDYHDEVFKRTTSNGNGLSKDDLYKISSDLGLSSSFNSCLDSEKYKIEIQKDIEDAQVVGATGTPTFIIGKSSEGGSIEGEKIIGAQPYSVFKATFDKLL